jgi:hypothetical protein
VAEAATTAILDFSGVKEGGASFNKKRVPTGDYLAKITKVQDSPTKDEKEPQWLYTIELVDKYTDRKFPFYCKLVPNQLWKLRNLFLAAGITIPKQKVKLNPNRVVGKLIGITLEDDEYDGKLQSNISQTFPASELEDGEDPEGDEEDTDDEATDLDEEDEEQVDDAEEEEDEEEEEEPEPEPVKTKARIPGQRKTSPAAAKKAPARRAAAKVAEVDDDELEELDLDDL